MSAAALVAPNPNRVLVVGASLAGLTAAYRLQSAGAEVSLFEARADMAVPSRTEDVEGWALSALPGTLPASSPELVGLAMELGVLDHIPRLALDRVVRFGASGPRALDLSGPLAGLGPPTPLRWLRRRRARRLLRWYGPWLDPRVPVNGARLDDRSLSDWSRLYLGASFDRECLAPLLETHFGLDSRATSRLLGLLLMRRWGQPGISLVGSISELRQTLVRRLKDLRTGEPVARVLASGGVELASGATEKADHVLVALRPERAAALLPGLGPAERVMLSRIHYAPFVQVAVVASEPSVRAERSTARPLASWIGGELRGPLAGWVELAPLQREPVPPGTRGFLLMARPDFAERAAMLPDTSIVDRLLGAADTYLPGIAARAKAVRLVRRSNAIPRFDVGHFRALARLREEAARAGSERAFGLCGEYWVGPQAEGAVVSGTQSAEAWLSARAARS